MPKLLYDHPDLCIAIPIHREMNHTIYTKVARHLRDATGLKQQGCFTSYSAAAAEAFRGDAAGKSNTHGKARWLLYARRIGQ